LERMLLEPARHSPESRMIVAGPMYPATIKWPTNVKHRQHIPPGEHRRFYNLQRYTLNLTRADMIASGYSPSVRLFEAAACGTPIISDYWQGLETVFTIGSEILVAKSTSDVVTHLKEIPEQERKAIAARAHGKVLLNHTADKRAAELENFYCEVLEIGSEKFLSSAVV
ncbi:MAG: glycosyltransferase, partial [Pyrinomonadaceae bacterium]